jgi:hypothetical protein
MKQIRVRYPIGKMLVVLAVVALAFNARDLARWIRLETM